MPDVSRDIVSIKNYCFKELFPDYEYIDNSCFGCHYCKVDCNECLFKGQMYIGNNIIKTCLNGKYNKFLKAWDSGNIRRAYKLADEIKNFPVKGLTIEKK